MSLKNNRGFTLVEIMIVAAMLGGISLVIMQLNKGSLQTQGDAVSMADYVQLQKEISFLISDGNSCTASLGATLGTPIVTGVTFNGSTIKNTPITGLELWSANQEIPPTRSRKKFYETQNFGKVAVSSISFSMPDYTAGVNFATGTNQSFKGELKISGNKLNMGKTKTFPDIIQSINVTFDTDAAGLSTIKSCYSVPAVVPASLGVGQTWQDMTALRTSGVTYTNNTGKPIEISVTVFTGSGPLSNKIIVNGLEVWNSYTGNYVGKLTAVVVVPDSATYSAVASPSISAWTELR